MTEQINRTEKIVQLCLCSCKVWKTLLKIPNLGFKYDFESLIGMIKGVGPSDSSLTAEEANSIWLLLP